MAVLTSNCLNLADWAKRVDPDGKIGKIVEMLSQTNDVLQDMQFLEGNLPTGHQFSVRSSLPTPAWRLINQGVSPSKSTTGQNVETCAILEAWSECDVELAKLGGNVGAFRLSEASAFVEAMGQEHASTLFYGNHGSAPEEFTGLAPRYNSLSGNIADQVINAGGSGSDNSSIYLVVWGENTVHGIFPKGSKAGLEHKDMGEVTVETTAGIAGSRMRAYQDQFIMKTGLCLKDYRYVVRIANIDVSAQTSQTNANDLVKSMIKAIHRIPSLAAGRAAFYMNRTLVQSLDIKMRDDVMSGGQLKYENVEGKPVMSFRGIPVRKCDALTESESVVS